MNYEKFNRRVHSWNLYWVPKGVAKYRMGTTALGDFASNEFHFFFKFSISLVKYRGLGDNCWIAMLIL
jgi:hypothetical protein